MAADGTVVSGWGWDFRYSVPVGYDVPVFYDLLERRHTAPGPTSSATEPNAPEQSA